MTRGLVLQVVGTGLATGAAYGLVAVGFALVHRLSGVVQLAHGDVLGVAVFVAIAVTVGTGPAGRTDVPVWRWVLGAAGAVAVAAVVSAAVFALAARPLRRARSPVAVTGAIAAVALAAQGLLSEAFPRAAYVLPDLYRFTQLDPIGVGDGAAIPVRSLWVLLTTVAVTGLAAGVLGRTPFGLALRAVADDEGAAALCGLRVDRLLAGAFALAGALAAVAGLVLAPATAFTPSSGALLGVKGIAAAVIGGLASPVRVLGAGLAIGVAEAAVASLHVPGLPSLGLGPAWRDLTAFTLVLAVLALHPPRAARERWE